MRDLTGAACRLAAAAIAACLFTQVVSAQTLDQKKALLKQVLDASAKIPARQKQLLSFGAQNFLHFAEQLNTPYAKPGIGGDGAQARVRLRAPVELAAGPGGTIQVSDPALDFVNSVLSGFTQSETSTAWCGNGVVVAYNDTGALLRTFNVNPGGAASIDGVSVSANGGRSFKDLGFLNPGSNTFNALAGDPVVNCSSASKFYYSSLLETAVTDSQGIPHPISAVSVSSSFTGGVTWGPPIIAVGKDATTHFLDKPWSTLDPANGQRIYVTYTDIDMSLTSAACPGDNRVAMESVTSADGGRTWTAPTIIEQVCAASGENMQGSNVLVAPDGSVYVAYEFFPATGDREIHITRSTNQGTAFGSIVKVTTQVVPNGGLSVLQGFFRINEFPQLAVDRSQTSSRGTLYIVWSDGRNNVVPDLESVTYAYPDVLLSKSTDSGQTFTAPIAVSPTPSGFPGTGRDQFFPGIAVDRDGHVGVCYYDRRADPANTVVDRYCSVSVTQGASWSELRVSTSNWLPVHFTDAALNSGYMGDYDALTSDALGINGGFFGAFEIETNGNPDVYARQF